MSRKISNAACLSGMITVRLERAQTGDCLCITLCTYMFPNGTAFESYWTKKICLKSCSFLRDLLLQLALLFPIATFEVK